MEIVLGEAYNEQLRDKRFQKITQSITQPSHISLMLAAIKILPAHECSVTNYSMTLSKEPDDCWG